MGEGAVRVYEYNGTNWVQIGQTLMGVAGGTQDRFGNSVKISADGNRIVVGSLGYSSLSANQDGAVYVFQFNGTVWSQLGNRIDAIEANELLGYSVSMNSSGDIIVAGAQAFDGSGNGLGCVRVYKFDGLDWQQQGQNIVGLNNFERIGESVDITSLGEKVVVGGINTSSGVVRVYENIVSNWTQVGSDIVGESNGDEFGSSVAISNDGLRVICGAPMGGNASVGYVKVYQTDVNNWSQVGQKIEGENNGSQVGGYDGVDISDFHDKIIIGERHNDSNGNSCGKGRVFYYNNNIWNFAGQIVGENAGDEMGQVTMSANGSRIALGARQNSDAGNSAGHVRIYDTQLVKLGEIISESNINIYPNPSNGALFISGEEVLEFKAYKVLNLQGQVLRHGEIDIVDEIGRIDLDLSQGSYYLWFENHDFTTFSYPITIL
jgi:hypothetical protein